MTQIEELQREVGVLRIQLKNAGLRADKLESRIDRNIKDMWKYISDNSQTFKDINKNIESIANKTTEETKNG